MKLPFPMWTLNTPVRVLQIDHNEDNAEVETVLFDGKARYDRKTRQVMNAQRELVQISGTVVCVGDIAFAFNETVFVEVDGEKKRVAFTNKPHNPDGSIYSSEFFVE